MRDVLEVHFPPIALDVPALHISCPQACLFTRGSLLNHPPKRNCLSTKLLRSSLLDLSFLRILVLLPTLQ
jgi:hypothetical protein